MIRLITENQLLLIVLERGNSCIFPILPIDYVISSGVIDITQIIFRISHFKYPIPVVI